MSSQCTQPACIYNCCNQYGQCPTSIRECVVKQHFDPLAVQIAVCVIVLLVLIAVALVLKCRWRKMQKNKASKESFLTQASVKNDIQNNIQIQMGLRDLSNPKQERQITLQIPRDEVTSYRKTQELDSAQNKRISDVFSTSRQSRISEQVQIFFSRRFSRILDDYQS